MGSGRRFYIFIQTCLIAGMILSGSGAAYSFYQYAKYRSNESLAVSMSVLARGRLIPNAHTRKPFKADISNAKSVPKNQKPIRVTI